MTELHAAFAVTAQADLEARTISGNVVPFGVVGYTNLGPTIIEAGAITPAEKVVYLMSHDHDRPIGRMISHEVTDAGITASFKILPTPNGDQALLEASEGVRDGLSVGLAEVEFHMDDDDNAIVTAAVWRETSQVTFPAFETARIQKVAASEAPAEDDPKTTEPEPGEETPTDEGDPVDESTAVAEATVPADLPRIRVQDPFPYGPHRADASYFRDMLHASQNPEAAERVRVAQTMLAAAGDPQDTTSPLDHIIPTAYRPDLYVGQLGVNRPFIDSFSNYSIANANPFRIPTFKTSSGLMADHVENTNPTPGTVEADEILVTPKAVSGSWHGSRELIEGSTPGIDAIVMNAIREEYAVDSEGYAATTIITGATDATDVDHGAPTMNMIANMNAFNTARLRSPNVMLLGTALFPPLATEIDLSGRPMNPYVGAQNADGSISGGVQSISIAGLVAGQAWSLAGGVLAVSTDAAVWESGLRMWRWEEVEGPATIKFAAFGYLAAAVLRKSGVHAFSFVAAA